MPLPENLQIHQLDLEIHGACNYKCEMCPQAWGRDRSFLKSMTFELFKKIVDDALQYGLRSVSLHGSGEPTLNKKMPDMVRYIKDCGLTAVSFTNGLRLEEELAVQLLDAELDLLRVSAIGYDEASYSRWMKPNAFDRVRENVRAFVELRNAKRATTQVHMYHLVTDMGCQDDEIALYRQNWTEYVGAESEVWLMHNWSGSYDEDVPYHRDSMSFGKKKRSCGRPFSPLLEVRAGGLDGHSGAVVACCMVLGQDEKAVLGHLDDQTIAEVVGGEDYQVLRAAHAEDRYDEVEYCKDCDQLYDIPQSLVWTNIEGRQYGQSKIANSLDHRSFSPGSSSEDSLVNIEPAVD